VTPFEALSAARFLSLTTYKRDGTPVATPVWVVSDDGHRLLVWTSAVSWKVKRLRRDSDVLVAPCDARGRLHGEQIEATARILPASDGALVQRLLRQKYRLAKPALDAVTGAIRTLRRRPAQPAAYLEIVPRATE
jgi:PPOX class probable F420-dependent enzyme